MDAGIRIEPITDDAGFRSLESCWNRLLHESNSNTIFLTWEWLYTWFKHLRGNRRLYILRFSSGEETIGVAPLVIRSAAIDTLMGVRVAEFLGARTAGADYLDLIIRRDCESRAIAAVGHFVRTTPMVLKFSHVKHGEGVASGWSIHMKRLGWRGFAAQSDVCPFIRLHGHTWQSYMAGLGSEHRYTLGRKLRKLSRKFQVKFERVDSEPQRSEALGLLISLHNGRWKQRSCTFNTPALVSFHNEFTQLALARGWLRLYVLRLNGEPVAVLYGLHYDDVFSFYQCGFDPAYGDYSVGTITMAFAIETAIGEGAREYDLLHGDEQYKSHWAKGVREIGHIAVFPPGLTGTLYSNATQLNLRLKRMARDILPKELAEVIAVKIRT